MEARAEIDCIIRELVKLMRTQSAVAKALGISPTLFNYWHNHAKAIPIEYVLAMKALLKSKKENALSQLPRRLLEKIVDEVILDYEPLEANETKEQPISKRVELAIRFESKLNLAKGRPSKKSEKNSRNCDILGRKTKALAKKFNFGSKDSYIRAKKVFLQGSPELIKAMDDKSISIYQAAMLSDFPFSIQLELLLKNTKERINFIKQKKNSQKFPIKAKTLNQDALHVVIFSDKELKWIESSYPLPKHLSSDVIIKSLITCCNQYLDLKTLREISSAIDSRLFLKVLCESSLKELKELTHA